MGLLSLKSENERSRIVFYSSKESYWRWANTAYLLIDIILILVTTSFVFYIRFAPVAIEKKPAASVWLSLLNYEYLPHYIGFLMLYSALLVLIFKNYELFHTRLDRLWVDEAISVFKAVSIATLLIMVVMYLSKQQVSRFVVLISWALSIFVLAGWRYLKRKIIERRIYNGNDVRRILIVGAGRVGKKLAHIFETNRHLGLNVKGFVDDYKRGSGILGGILDMPDILQSHFIDEVYITIPSERDIVKIATRYALSFKADVKVIPDLLDGVVPQNRPMTIGLVGDLPVMELHRTPIPEVGLFIKRTIDLTFGIIMLILTLPIFIIIASLIKVTSPREPIMYSSNRVGKKGKYFRCYKFRTMSSNADELKDKLRALNEKSGPVFKIKDDPRITKVGKYLRKYSLDELPQLLNLIIGDMSLVGPRPHPIDDFELYDLAEYRRLDVKPGITSLWAVKARNDPSFERNMELDLFYIENWSIWLDLEILLRTIPTVLKGTGI